MTTSNNTRGRPAAIEGTHEEPGSRDTQVQPSSQSHHDEAHSDEIRELASILDRRNAELARDAVSYQVDVRSRNKQAYPEEIEPIEAHYDNNHNFNFEPEELYRVWHRTNTELHLSTFLVVDISGTVMKCLKIVQREPAAIDQKFWRTHRKLKPEMDTGSHRLRSASRPRSKQQEEGQSGDEESEELMVFMKNSQRLREDCWVDLRTPWSIDWQKEYRFVYCGCLHEESFRKAVTMHLKDYNKMKNRISE